MINRSTLKYSLKRILPSFVFSCIHFIWQKLLLGIVEYVDTLRLKKFTNEQLATLTQNNISFKLYISPRNGFIDNYIYLYGVYESFMLDIIKKNLSKGMTYVDIGANIGQHSMFAASIVGKTGSVYAFEPIPHVYDQLTRSAYANDFTTIVNAKNFALGEKGGTETLYISNKNIGGSSLVNKEEGNEKITVTIKNGDSELLPLPRVDMIKIDVEGYEYEVLSGIQKTIAKHKPCILIEFSGYFYETEKKNHGKKILQLLKDNDYKIYDIEDDMKMIDDNDLFLSNFVHDRKQTNLFCSLR